jgi:oligoendopeptidase F
MSISGDYRYWLEEMRHFKPHTLSEPEEKIINIKNVTGSSALTTLYDTITNRYTFKIEVDGEEKELTRDALMVYARHHRADLREKAYREQYRVYGNDGTILGQMYQTLVRDWRNEQVGLRKFESPIAARNLINDIPDEVVDTLLDVCQDNAPVFQRFFRLKARLLGMKRLRRYDIYAPVVESDKTYDFNTAASTVFSAFRSFDPQFESLARRVFDENRVDSEVRKGKRGGAFCWTVTRI